MRENRTGRIVMNVARMILLVFYALALTVVIGCIQLGTFLVMKIVKRCRIHSAAERICVEK